MSPMSDLLEQTQALETLINAIVVTKTKDLEAEIKRLRKDLDKLRTSSSGLPPYIIVEGQNDIVAISRQAAESCQSSLVSVFFFVRMSKQYYWGVLITVDRTDAI